MQKNDFGFSIQNAGGDPTLCTNQGAAQAQPQVLGKVSMRPASAHVEFTLAQGQQVLADSGSMLWMKPSKDQEMGIKTWCHGGCFNAWCRASCAGEPCCQNLHTGPGVVAFGYNLPGDILPFVCTPDNPWIISQGMFICGDSSIVVGAKFKGMHLCCDAFCCAGQCLGEGPFLTHVTTQSEAAIFYAGGYGEIQQIEIAQNQTLLLNSGLFFAGHADTPLEGAMPGDCKSLCCSGEGLVLKIEAKEAPIRVYIQNRDQSTFERILQPMPEGGQGGGDGAGDAAGAAA